MHRIHEGEVPDTYTECKAFQVLKQAGVKYVCIWQLGGTDVFDGGTGFADIAECDKRPWHRYDSCPCCGKKDERAVYDADDGIWCGRCKLRRTELRCGTI